MPKKPHVDPLRKEIAKKLGIKIAQIYKKAKDLANQAQSSTEEGIFLLAAKTGINLNQYLPKERVTQIRELLFKLNQQYPPLVSNKSPVKKLSPQIHNVSIGKTLSVKDPLLTGKILTEAKAMAEEVYPLLYVFENSVREMIIRVMQKVHGNNWWEIKVPRDIQEEVKKRKAKEKSNPWHGKRNAQPIYYSDLDHLARIVQKNWSDFKTILPSQPWLMQRLNEISHSRNPVAHMNPLGKNDIQRIKVYFSDWQKQMTENLKLFP